MPFKYLQDKLPKPKDIKKNPYLKVFGDLLQDENIWRLNQHSLSLALFIGVFWACMPIPFQMVAAAGCAILLRANLPVSVALVWISNPVTMPPIFYFNYSVGSALLGHSDTYKEFELSLEWFTNSMGEIWQPLFLGSFTVGFISGLLAFLTLKVYFKVRNPSVK